MTPRESIIRDFLATIDILCSIRPLSDWRVRMDLASESLMLWVPNTLYARYMVTTPALELASRHCAGVQHYLYATAKLSCIGFDKDILEHLDIPGVIIARNTIYPLEALRTELRKAQEKCQKQKTSSK